MPEVIANVIFMTFGVFVKCVQSVRICNNFLITEFSL
jgi:hypothetical protein